MVDNAARNKAIIIEVLTSAFTKRDFTALKNGSRPSTFSITLLFPAVGMAIASLSKNSPKDGITNPEWL